MSHRWWSLRRAAGVLRGGGIVAYPTESVFGLGCDPLRGEAVERLLRLKGRGPAKGLILLAAGWEQLGPFLGDLDPGLRAAVDRTWPGPVTWLLPARSGLPGWINGGGPQVAVRVSAHPVAAALARAFGGALVSTSANRSGRPPARTPLAVRRSLGADVEVVIHGRVGGLGRPTEIRDGGSGLVVRAGDRPPVSP